MRKFLLILFAAICSAVTVNAQVQGYQAGSFSCKVMDNYGNWSSWSDWQRSSVKIVLDLNNDMITIYSPTTQYYKVVQFVGVTNDNSGGTQSVFNVIDADGDRAVIRLRIQADGTSQLYVDFADAMWVYGNIRRVY